MNTTGSYRNVRVYLNKQFLSFTYELRNLSYIMYMIQNQMTFYTAAMTDVIAYIDTAHDLSLIHISEPTRRYAISYAVFCLKKKNE